MYRWPTGTWKYANITIRQMQIQTTMRYYLISVRKALIKMTANRPWWSCGEKGDLAHGGHECELAQPLWKTGGRRLRKWRPEPPYGPAMFVWRKQKHSFEKLHVAQCSTEYYSAIKKNEISPFSTTWLNLEFYGNSMLGEMSDIERQMLYVFIYMWNLKKG